MVAVNSAKTYVLDQNGKFLNRDVKTEGSKEYILHKGMKAVLETLPEKKFGDYVITQKRIAYYVDKKTTLEGI